MRLLCALHDMRRRAAHLAFASLILLCSASPGWAQDGWVNIGPPGLEALKIVVDPRTPTTVYALGGMQIFKSTDSGVNWDPLTTFGDRVSSLAIDPQTPTTMYAALSTLLEGVAERPIQLMKSTDGGQSWTPLGALGAVAINPHTPATLHASGSYRSLPLGQFASVPLSSADGGANWVTGPDLELGHAISRILIDPRDPNTVYAGTITVSQHRGSELWRSRDGGVTWTVTALNIDLSTLDRGGARVRLLAVDPVRPDTVYVARRIRSGGDTLLRTSDGGTTWVALTNGLPRSNFGVTSLTVDPVNPANLYLADDAIQTNPGSIFRSTDGGERWEPYNAGLGTDRQVSDLVADGHGSVYAATRSGVLVRRSAVSNAVRLEVSPTSFGPGATLTATWSGLPAPTPWDWIGLFVRGTSDSDYLAWIYTSCITEPGSGSTAGACPFPTSSSLPDGAYELRLFPGDGSTPRVLSNPITVSGVGIPTLTAADVTLGSAVTAFWDGIGIPTATDWLALYPAGASDQDFLAWVYVSCTKVATNPLSQGSCSLSVPANLAAGSYEVRLFANAASGSYNRIASTSFTAAAGRGPSLVVVRFLGAIDILFNDIATPSTTDWFGLFEPGAPNDAYLAWVYVSCTTEPTRAERRGQCYFPMPPSLPPGQYEFRLFANNGYGVLAVSPPFAEP